MNKKKLLVIVNPISGTASKDGLADRLRSGLRRAGFEIDIAMTERAGHGFKLARQGVEDNYYGILAAGGDGTVNEIASAVRGSDTVMGILPYGSGNGLARHIYGSIDIDHSIDVISRDFPQRCDYGTVNGTPFFCTFGLGFDAKVSQQFSKLPTRGLTTYIKSAIQEYLTFSPTEYRICSDSKEVNVKAFIVAVCNASQYGNNAFIAPQASIRDGLLDIMIIHEGNPLTRALAGVELFTGHLDHNLLIETMRVEKATIKHLPGPAHIDGEPMMTPETLNIECHKGDIKLFYDPQKPPFRPFLTPIESMRNDSQFVMRENTRNAIKSLKEKLSKIF
ncbi:MAG: diacylglycerol kinase family lipid kinase [Bacteroidales bacterium]|nr:diacylglycerol kinase family lipid kinase [Bacteroidales bacterium]MBD5205464.1 diacylglycerol kinase family lipid kinase [Bacteroidales bacterium]MBD5224239.1 diacylglycerol kinase family lipid kinase [Bacteroidales bacterium]